MDQAEQKENVKLADEERAALVDAKIIAPEKAELIPEEYALACEALRQSRLKTLDDERIATGLPTAEGFIQNIRRRQQKIPRRSLNTPDVTPGDPEEVAEAEWEKYEAPLTGKSAPVQRMAEARQQAGPRLVQLDPTTVLKIELLSARKRANMAEERLAVLALQDARKAKQELEQEQAQLMQLVTKQLNLPAGKSIRLVDREKGLCQVE